MGFRFFNIRRLSCCKKPYSFYYVQTIFYSTMLYCKFYFFSVIDFLLSCNCRRCFIRSLYNTIWLFYISTHIITVLLSFFHLTYEAPFLLLRHLMKYTQYVLNERLYLNALVVPHLKPYLEVGYGIGTHIFDFGLFASFANWKYQEIGCKFTFELFNR